MDGGIGKQCGSMNEISNIRGSIDGIKKRLLKITILGASKSGKSALTVRFLTGKFIYEYATGEDLVYQYIFSLSSSQVPLEIVDTSQSENTSSAVGDADGVIVVYAIDNQKSFEKAQELVTHIRNSTGKIPCTALVGNKSDLWQYKSVNTADAKNLAKKYRCSYFEMSALSDRDGVRDMFKNIITLMIERTKFTTRSLSLPSCKLQETKIPPPRQRSASFHIPKKEKKCNRKKGTDKNSNIVCKTLLGGMGHIAFTAIALPVFQE